MRGPLLLRCTPLACYTAHDPWVWGQRDEAARVHYAPRRRACKAVGAANRHGYSKEESTLAGNITATLPPNHIRRFDAFSSRLLSYLASRANLATRRVGRNHRYCLLLYHSLSRYLFLNDRTLSLVGYFGRLQLSFWLAAPHTCFQFGRFGFQITELKEL